MYGVYGKLLIVDLSKMDIIEKELEQEVFYEFLGGRGLGAYLLAKMLAPGEDPLSPNNVIVFATGPATDSGLAPASGYGIFTKSPVTGLFTEAYAKGYLPSLIKRTGYDAIVITGAASYPSFITISELGVNFYDAVETWGMDTDTAEGSILNVVGATDSEVLVIGPAGENMIASACLKSNRHRSFGRAGLGAVFGSKNLKGVVFRGGAKAELYESEAFTGWNDQFIRRCNNEEEAKAIKIFSIPSLVTVANTRGFFTSGYWAEGRLEGWEKIVESYRSGKVSAKGLSCHSCLLSCDQETFINYDHCRRGVKGLDYNYLSAIGGLCRITSLEDIVSLVDLCEQLGIDPVSAGNIASFAIEAGLRGKLDNPPLYGNSDRIALFLESVAYRKGEGVIFADGIREAAAMLDMPDLAVHFRGLEPAGFDPRVIKIVALSHLVSGFGESNPESFYLSGLGYGLFDTEKRNNPARIFVEYEDKMNIIDSLVFCRNAHKLIQWENLIAVVFLLTGKRYSAAGLRAVSARNLSTIRLFNLSEVTTGMGDSLPSRFIEEPINNEKDLVKVEELELMLKDYYLLRGWNEKGIPPAGNNNQQLLRRTIQCL
ncbi:MAG: aldehyde ferredoxin oxidoreductase C-terminal domain-containing protein [Bacillota bacterium]|nr:aldehyde ferredoxin oxidoreductase C-terminal domain-containing protein [Bacillota bacterium]